MSNSYVLVNPYIHGEFKTNIKAKNSAEAAKKFYKDLSEHFNNAVPKFYFTIQKGGSGKGKYYHFKVKENKVKDDVNFTIEPHELLGGDSNLISFNDKLSKIKNRLSQTGGKKKKSKKVSESDSESSSDYFKRETKYVPVNSQPIYYWWYDPSIYRLESYYIPTFYSYVTPIIQISVV